MLLKAEVVKNDPKPALLTDRKRVVVSLRLVMTLAVVAVSFPQVMKAGPSFLTVLVLYFSTNFVLCFEKRSVFLQRFPVGSLLIFDLAVVTVLMALSGETRAVFYEAFFLIILMAALTRSALASSIIAAISAVIYSVVVGTSEPAGIFDIHFSTRIALFFVTALFAGYMAQEIRAGRKRQDHLLREMQVERGHHRRFESFYRVLFEQSADGILLVGKDKKVKESNSKMEEILGRNPIGESQRNVLNLTDTDVRPVNHSEAPEAAVDYQEVFGVDLTTTSGTKVPCEVTVRSFSVEGEPYRLFLLRDVRAMRENDKRMAEFEKKSMLGGFISSITHEINNSLYAVVGFSELILSGQASASEIQEYAKHILDGGRRCKKVVKGFLEQSRSKAFSPESAYLGEIVRKAVALMHFHVRYHLVRVTLILDNTVKVIVDEQQIEHVVLNLMSNAVRAMQGRPKRLLMVQAGPGPKGALIEVKDTGCGIPSDNLPRLFQRGFTETTDGTGHGLGLALCQEIIARHDGEIHVESIVEKVTSFSVHLPIAKPATRKKTETILVVEDEAEIRDFISNVLQEQGYTVLVAGDVGKAIEICKQHTETIHLLVTDVVMPKMNGRQLAAELVKLRRGLKVLYMSGYTDNTLTHHGAVDSGVALLQKPIRPDTLLKKVREVMNVENANASEKKVVLLVDDDEILLELIAHDCANKGYEMVGVSTVSAALNEISKRAFDVLVVDMNIPGTDGYRILREIRATGNSTPALIHTGDASSVDMDALGLLGVVEVVEKSNDSHQLLKIIQETTRAPRC